MLKNLLHLLKLFLKIGFSQKLVGSVTRPRAMSGQPLSNFSEEEQMMKEAVAVLAKREIAPLVRKMDEQVLSIQLSIPILCSS